VKGMLKKIYFSIFFILILVNLANPGRGETNQDSTTSNPVGSSSQNGCINEGFDKFNVMNIQVSNNNIVLNKGENATISPIVNYIFTFPNNNVCWYYDNSDIVKISGNNGDIYIEALKPGNVKLIAKASKNSNVTKEVYIRVKNNKPEEREVTLKIGEKYPMPKGYLLGSGGESQIIEVEGNEIVGKREGSEVLEFYIPDSTPEIKTNISFIVKKPEITYKDINLKKWQKIFLPLVNEDNKIWCLISNTNTGIINKSSGCDEKNFNLEAKEEGKTRLIFEKRLGDNSGSFLPLEKIVFNIYVSDEISKDLNHVEIYAGDKPISLFPYLSRKEKDDIKILWNSKDESIATVENGFLKGCKPGNTYIWATLISEKEVSAKPLQFVSKDINYKISKSSVPPENRVIEEEYFIVKVNPQLAQNPTSAPTDTPSIIPTLSPSNIVPIKSVIKLKFNETKDLNEYLLNEKFEKNPQEFEINSYEKEKIKADTKLKKIKGIMPDSTSILNLSSKQKVYSLQIEIGHEAGKDGGKPGLSSKPDPNSTTTTEKLFINLNETISLKNNKKYQEFFKDKSNINFDLSEDDKKIVQLNKSTLEAKGIKEGKANVKVNAVFNFEINVKKELEVRVSETLNLNDFFPGLKINKISNTEKIKLEQNNNLTGLESGAVKIEGILNNEVFEIIVRVLPPDLLYILGRPWTNALVLALFSLLMTLLVLFADLLIYYISKNSHIYSIYKNGTGEGKKFFENQRAGLKEPIETYSNRFNKSILSITNWPESLQLNKFNTKITLQTEIHPETIKIIFQVLFLFATCLFILWYPLMVYSTGIIDKNYLFLVVVELGFFAAILLNNIRELIMSAFILTSVLLAALLSCIFEAIILVLAWSAGAVIISIIGVLIGVFQLGNYESDQKSYWMIAFIIATSWQFLFANFIKKGQAHKYDGESSVSKPDPGDENKEDPNGIDGGKKGPEKKNPSGKNDNEPENDENTITFSVKANNENIKAFKEFMDKQNEKNKDEAQSKDPNKNEEKKISEDTIETINKTKPDES
jgi:hypothetical protein